MVLYEKKSPSMIWLSIFMLVELCFFYYYHFLLYYHHLSYNSLQLDYTESDITLLHAMTRWSYNKRPAHS